MQGGRSKRTALSTTIVRFGAAGFCGSALLATALNSLRFHGGLNARSATKLPFDPRMTPDKYRFIACLSPFWVAKKRLSCVKVVSNFAHFIQVEPRLFPQPAPRKRVAREAMRASRELPNRIRFMIFSPARLPTRAIQPRGVYPHSILRGQLPGHPLSGREVVASTGIIQPSTAWVYGVNTYLSVLHTAGRASSKTSDGLSMSGKVEGALPTPCSILRKPA